jgi:hypothetical protein
MRRLRPCAYSALVAFALAGCASTEAPGRVLHQWTDAAGSVRYTEFPEDVPRARQHTLQLVQVGTPARRSAPPAAGPVAAIEADPVDVAAARPPAAPSAAAPAPAPPAPPAVASLDTRIAELEARIETEQEALKVLISDPAAAAELRGSPQLREIGERLPALQSELEELRKQRAEAAETDGG